MTSTSGACLASTAPCVMLSGQMAQMPTPRSDLSGFPDQEKYSSTIGRGLRGVRASARADSAARASRNPSRPGNQVRSLGGCRSGGVRPVVHIQPLDTVNETRAAGSLSGRRAAGLEGVPNRVAFPQEEPTRVDGVGTAPARPRASRLSSRGPNSPLHQVWQAWFETPGETPSWTQRLLRATLDLFRLEDFMTMIIGTERFVEAVRRLGYEQDILFRELPLR